MATTPGDSDSVPQWMSRLLLVFVVYVVGTSIWMMTGAGGARTQHYVGLLADGPANLVAVIMTAAAARRLPWGALRTGWGLIAAALALYFVGTVIGQESWLRGVDPFPGIADVFYLAFYLPAFAAVLFLARARSMQMPWARLALCLLYTSPSPRDS